MDTEKLYDRDAFLKEFDAVVTDCPARQGGHISCDPGPHGLLPGGRRPARQTTATWAARRCWTSRSGTAWCSTPATGP